MVVNTQNKHQIECSDCWSPAERRLKHIVEKGKKYLFYPLIMLLKKLKVTANMVSYASALVGLGSAIYAFYDIKISAILLIISLLLDGIDGSLARASNSPKLKGSITDCFADQIVISSTTIVFIAMGIINPIIGGLYLVAYPTHITFTILKNIINKPNKYVFRPRIFVYVAFWLYAFFGINYLNYTVLPISIILLLYIFHDFYSLRRHL